MIIRYYLAALILLFLFNCNSQSGDISPLIPKDTTNENERNNRLFVFIGEKIEVSALPPKPGVFFDNGFKAKYKVLMSVYGYYAGNTIEFEAYDHYGTPPFSRYKNVMLFVVEEGGRYYHEKYQFFDVYRTKNGRWAGSYAQEDYEFLDSMTVKPEKIEFAEEVAYPLSMKDSQGKMRYIYYPEPYFKITGDKAIPVYGNYIEDLFRLKKEGILTNRQLFGNKEFKNPEIRLEDIR